MNPPINIYPLQISPKFLSESFEKDRRLKNVERVQVLQRSQKCRNRSPQSNTQYRHQYAIYGDKNVDI